MATAPQNRQDASSGAAIRLKKLDIVADAVHLAIPWGCLLGIGICIAFATSRLAGKATLAQIGMSFVGDIRVSDAVAYMFGAAGVGYGVLERRLRHKKTKSMAAYSAELETKLDPNRSSSGLTPEGTTRDEDRL